MAGRILYPFLCLFLLLDLGYSFHQHFQMALDGDMASIILPAEGYSAVLNDPFGLRVLLHGEHYPAPNRFFAHWTMSKYFKSVPFLFQAACPPIDSIYAASALAKTLIQGFLIWLLATYISGKTNPFRKEFILAAVLITPLFQTFGYNIQMGIIDKSVTYTFFFALPLGLLLLFFLPFFRSVIRKENWTPKPLQMVLLALLAVILSFNGPLIPGVVLIVCPFILVYSGWKKKLTRPHLFLFLFISAWCLYSFFIGMNNAENAANSLPVGERYLRIPHGLFALFSQKIGPPLLLVVTISNVLILRRFKKNPQARMILHFSKWIALFALLYLFLLPLGGYREYRPDIVRRDTMMPLFLCLFLLFGWSSSFLIHHLSSFKKGYLALIVGVLLLFTFADAPHRPPHACEREGLEILSRSQEPIVRLPSDCNILSWTRITDPKGSEWNAQLLMYWGVTDKKRLYFQSKK
ncbi:MAG: hypothetical protein H6563_03840 [Lewinellaceae bacterium]|nr:hypothetical protein [Lewinellaceae bacterium]